MRDCINPQWIVVCIGDEGENLAHGRRNSPTYLRTDASCPARELPRHRVHSASPCSGRSANKDLIPRRARLSTAGVGRAGAQKRRGSYHRAWILLFLTLRRRPYRALFASANTEAAELGPQLQIPLCDALGIAASLCCARLGRPTPALCRCRWNYISTC